jgi:hypothetical protein
MTVAGVIVSRVIVFMMVMIVIWWDRRAIVSVTMFIVQVPPKLIRDQRWSSVLRIRACIICAVPSGNANAQQERELGARPSVHADKIHFFRALTSVCR